MIEAGESVAVGVSGGADSMCLLHILNSLKEKYGIKLVAVHVHHGIRGDGADRDATFVEEYCSKEKIPFHLFRYDVPTLAKEWAMSCEETGRKVRYEAFEQVLEKECEGKGKIAVAHNADDCAETVLLNLFRGSGIRGLTGIQPVRDKIIRPVLCLTRNEIEQYNRENSIEYVTDETNLTEEYTRNKIRLGIMPVITKEINDKAREHINMTAESLGLIDDYMVFQCEQVFKQLVQERDGLYIDEAGFKNLHQAMKWQLVKGCLYKVAGRAKDITRSHMEDVINLFNMQVGKQINLPYGMVAKKQYESVIITKRQDDSGSQAHIDEEGREVINIDGAGTYKGCIKKQYIELAVDEDVFKEEIFNENQYTKWIDCDIIKFNLQLRTRRQGDYIVLDSDGSRKKLKDYFIDKKIPKEERDNVLLVANGSEIVWVIGYRLSGAYKVRDNSRNVFKLHMDIKHIN